MLCRCDRRDVRVGSDGGRRAISGFVVDGGWAALAGAVVQVQNVADGTMTRATTEGKGEFLAAHLPAGVPRRGGVCVASRVWRPILGFRQ